MPTWLPGPRLRPHLGGRGGPRTVHHHRRRALVEGGGFAFGPYLPAAAQFPYQPATRFPEREGGLGVRGRHRGDMGRPHGRPVAYGRRRAALVVVFFGPPVEARLVGKLGPGSLIGVLGARRSDGNGNGRTYRHRGSSLPV